MNEDITVIEAYFANMLNLPFITVMPKSTPDEIIARVKFYGISCHLVDDAKEIYLVVKDLAKKIKGHFMDQFTYAHRATDWRGNNNIAQNIFSQIA